MKLSICMMVKNEGKHLEQCLVSLQPILDGIDSELIIVDTGSEDQTVEIARKYTDNVYFQPWNNDFANMRNKTIQYAKGEWLFILDGDEVVRQPEKIISFLDSKKSKKYNSGMFTLRNMTKENDESANIISSALRLFRNHNHFHYEGVIHEQPQYELPVFELKIEILHYGYVSTDKKLMEYKFRRNTELLQRELEKEPENIYYWYQLSQSYGMHKDYEKSLETSLKAYEIAGKKKIDLKSRMYIYTHLAISYYWNKGYKELEDICIEGLKKNAKVLDLYYFLGKAQKSLGKGQEAIDHYKTYLKLIETNQYMKGPSIPNATLERVEEVYLDLCILYQREKKNQIALKYAKKIKSETILNIAIPYIIKVYINLKKYIELKEYYLNSIQSKNKEIIYRFWSCLENSIQKLDREERQDLIALFSDQEDEYSLLNKIRVSMKEDSSKLERNIFNKIKNMDFKSLPIFFGEIPYYYMKNQISLVQIWNDVREDIMQEYLNYLSQKQDDLSEVIIKYLQNSPKEYSLKELRIRKVLERNVLILDEIEKEDFQSIWNQYIEDGTYYITKIYHPDIIENEEIYDIKSDEDAFLLYMLLARKNREQNNPLEYIRYLRKALKIYPIMKKGIEILKKEAESKKDRNKFNSQRDEFEQLKQQVKKNIQVLLKANQIGQAKSIIDQYLQVVPNDLEMLVLKSEIQLQLM